MPGRIPGRLGTKQTLEGPQRLLEEQELGKDSVRSLLCPRASRLAPISHFGKCFEGLCLQTHKVNSFGLVEGRFSRCVLESLAIGTGPEGEPRAGRTRNQASWPEEVPSVDRSWAAPRCNLVTPEHSDVVGTVQALCTFRSSTNSSLNFLKIRFINS